jgi:hypothetical protein
MHCCAFPPTSAVVWTDADFLAQTDDARHRGTMPLSKLPTGLCLGIVRGLLNFWPSGPVSGSIRLQSRSAEILSDRLVDLVNAVPREFARRPRSVSGIDECKAVEFRQFCCIQAWLLYLELYLKKFSVILCICLLV